MSQSTPPQFHAEGTSRPASVTVQSVTAQSHPPHSLNSQVTFTASLRVATNILNNRMATHALDLNTRIAAVLASNNESTPHGPNTNNIASSPHNGNENFVNPMVSDPNDGTAAPQNLENTSVTSTSPHNATTMPPNLNTPAGAPKNAFVNPQMFNPVHGFQHANTLPSMQMPPHGFPSFSMIPP